jgi:hypothetical protein
MPELVSMGDVVLVHQGGDVFDPAWPDAARQYAHDSQPLARCSQPGAPGGGTGLGLTVAEGIITQHESLYANWKSAASLVLTLALSIFVAVRLFRWEKDEKLKGSAKLWVAGVMVPFIALGVYQFRTSEQTVKNRMLWRQLQRGDAFLIRNARVFVGDGRVIENGSVLVRKGRIEGVYEGAGPDAAGLKAEVVEASGKTIMPGLIDVHVHLGAPGGMYANPKDFSTERIPERALAQYLYSGVTTVKSTGDTLDASIALRKRVMDGELLGAELYISGPLFTTEGGHGTEYFSWLEGPAKAAIVEQFVRTPASADQAREQVRQLKVAGVDAIKAVLETGRTGMLFARMDLAMFRAVIGESGAQRLPSSVHTGSARDVEDAVDAGATSIPAFYRDRLTDAALSHSTSFTDPAFRVSAGVGHEHAAGPIEPTVAILVEHGTILGAIPHEGRLAAHGLRLELPELLKRRHRVRVRQRRGNVAILCVHPRHRAGSDAEFFAHGCLNLNSTGSETRNRPRFPSV